MLSSAYVRKTTRRSSTGGSIFLGPRLWMGPGTESIPIELFAHNRRRLSATILAKNSKYVNAIIFMQGGDLIPFYNTDVCHPFRQESYFMWTFGVTEPGYSGLINIENGQVVLFMPKVEVKNSLLTFPHLSAEEVKHKYKVDRVHYVYEIASVIKSMRQNRILVMSGVNSDSGVPIKEVSFEGMKHFLLEGNCLFNEITELRVIKTAFELDVMRHVNNVTCAALLEVMKSAQSNTVEYHFEAIFKKYCLKEAGFQIANMICCSGANNSVVHCGYPGASNTRVVLDGEMCMFDANAEYYGYTSDVTVSFPISGKFTDDQKDIYNIVYSMYMVGANALKPDVLWNDVHTSCMRVLLRELKRIDVVRGEIDTMIKLGIGEIFQPHGIGHLIGLDVYDVGGYTQNTALRPAEQHLRVLRTCRVLEKGMCIALEPGCYFFDESLEHAMQTEASTFFNLEAINKYRAIGGVRIEDNFYITENGNINLTTLPRSIDEIEAFMSSGDTSKYSNN